MYMFRINEQSLFRETIWIFSLQKFLLLTTALFMCSSILPIRGVLGDDCTAVPISLSSLKRCSGNQCYFSQTVSAAIPITPSASLCMLFVPPDNIGSPFYVNFTIDNALYMYNAEYSYHTDQPYIAPAGCCGCANFNTDSCPSCASLDIPGDHDFCVSGSHADPTCVSGGGHYTFQLNIQPFRRYKVIKIKPTANKFMSVHATYANTSLYSTYIGVTKEVDDASSHINFTLVSDTASPIISPEFVVYDFTAQEDFYMLDSSMCNALDEFNPRKFGWIKSDTHPMMDPSTGSLITASILDCPSMQFRWNIPHIDQTAFLTSNRQRLSESLAPGATLFDPEFDYYPDIHTQPNHIIQPYTYIKTGWLLAGVSGTPVFFGISVDGHTIPSASATTTNANGITVTTIDGLDRNLTTWSYSYVNIKGVEFAHDSAFLALYVNPGNYSEYGVCYGFNISAPADCTNVTFTAMSWPDFRIKAYSFRRGFLTDDLQGPSNISTVKLETPILSGVLNVVVSFKNLSVQFENSAIKSRINYITANSTTLMVNAQSITVGGTCYLDATPTGLVITQPIDLTVSPTNYYYAYNIYSFTGVALIRITCFNHVSTKNIYLETTETPTEQGVTGGITEPLPNDGTSSYAADPKHWLPAWGNLFGTDIFGDIGKGFTKVQWFVHVIILVAIGVGLFLTAMLLVYATIKLIGCIKMTKSGIRNKFKFGRGSVIKQEKSEFLKKYM